MALKCCVPNCKGNYDNDNKVHVFKFPKDEVMQQRWLRAIPRQDYQVTNYSVVCHRHFKASDVLWEVTATDSKTGKTLTASLPRPRLSENAVPCIFPNSPSYLSSHSATSREKPDKKRSRINKRFLSIMEQPVFIKCEPGWASDTAELNKTDPDVKLPTEEQVKVKIEPEDVFYKPFIKEELEIQDVKIETYDEVNDASGVTLNENQTLPACLAEPKATYRDNRKKDRSPDQCNICGKWFTRTSTLREHLFLHSGQKPHKCNECGKAFAQVSTWRTHLLVHTGEKKHCCPICDGRFGLKSSLKRHVLTHSKETPFKCINCEKAFTHKSYLAYHMISHTRKYPHACIACGKTFRRRGALRRHCVTHSGEQPYLCNTCGMRFSTLTNLSKHDIVHFDEREFSCTICSKAFSKRQYLKVHMAVHLREVKNSSSAQ